MSTRNALATIKAMIEENHDPRKRDDMTQHRLNGVLAEVYACACQGLAQQDPVQELSHTLRDLSLHVVIVLSQIDHPRGVMQTDIRALDDANVRAGKALSQYGTERATRSMQRT